MKAFKKHIVILSGLILISLILFFTDSINEARSTDKGIFQVADTSSISSLRIERGGRIINIDRSGDHWVLNDTMKVDPSLIRILYALMSQIEVDRPVSSLDLEDIKRELGGQSSKVSIDGGQEISFVAGGSPDKSKSYFGDKDLENIYLVGIPGYDNYVTGIFELTLNQWRDRVLFSSNLRSIQSLEIKFLETNRGLKMKYKDDFIEVEGVSEMDTSSVLTYLKQFERFQHNDYLNEGQFPRYDSLKEESALATISVRDINSSKNVDLTVYPKIPGERFYLLLDSKNQMIVIDENRVNSLLRSSSDFTLK